MRILRRGFAGAAEKSGKTFPFWERAGFLSGADSLLYVGLSWLVARQVRLGEGGASIAFVGIVPNGENTTLKETLRGLEGFLMRIRSLLIAGVLVSASLAARADSYTTFDLNSSYFFGGTIDGTLTLDTTTDLFSSADLTVSGFPSYQNGTLNQVGLQSPSFLGYDLNVYSNGSPYGDVDLFLQTITLAGYDGSSISFPTNVQFGSFPSLYFAGSGTLEPTSVTPEPGSLMLLGTGLLGFAEVVRRRLAV